MKKADLHIHTLLSPCGDLSMTPANIVARAKEEGIDIIGITDHNSTRQARLVKQLAQREGIFVVQGAEVTTKEEVHCLCLFPSDSATDAFQIYLDKHLPAIKNRPGLFGDQVVVNEKEEIIYEEPHLLLVGLTQNLDQIAKKTHSLGGLFIPAHVNRKQYGLISQLGLVPDSLEADAYEVHPSFPLTQPLPRGIKTLQHSDAHFPKDIGRRFSYLDIDGVNFENIKAAITSRSQQKDQ